MSDLTVILFSIALMLITGFLFSRLFDLIHLPSVTAYLLAGILIGPHVGKLVPAEVVAGTECISDIALAFIAFSVGSFFNIKKLRDNSRKVIFITLAETLTASAVVFAACRMLLHLPMEFSIVLAALAAATAPASTLMTIRQTGSKGTFVDTLLQVIALDDVVGLIGFSAALSIAVAGQNAVNLTNIFLPIAKNLASIALGAVFGFLLAVWMTKASKKEDSRLLPTLGLLVLFTASCAKLDVSPLLGCMVIGTVYVNKTEDQTLFAEVSRFAAPILVLFFVRSGMNFNLTLLFSAGGAVGSVSLVTIAIVYFFTRMAGKYAGTFMGSALSGAENSVRNYLGLALIPQASVAIGLASMSARMLGGDLGGKLQAIILLSSVLYELVGPSCAKLALWLSGSFGEASHAKKELSLDAGTVQTEGTTAA